MQPLRRRPRALIVDDEPDIRELLSMTLERLDVDTRVAGDVAAARRALEEGEFELCLTDLRLPDGSGLELVQWLGLHDEHVAVAVITAHGDVESAVQALKAGAFDFISKPVKLDALRRLVNTALRIPRDTTVQAGENDSRLLGLSRPMEELRQLIGRVARSQAPVHIFGEAGVGKELVARLIHQIGPRADAAFVPVNCGAIPGELMESEFFGHIKGSFTGAVADKSGLFQSAQGGTLFLDEIADLPLHMQVKLLRVIQEKAVRPVGDTREHPVDVRIVSATNRSLAELVEQGRFREDLYYRINVIELTVPPLRERGNDVLMLADRILLRLAQQCGTPAPELTTAARNTLLAYAFPGNVRELENILERALTLSPSGIIDSQDLQLRSDPGTYGGGELEARLRKFQIDAIQEALARTNGNQTAAAKLLGLTPRKLSYRIKSLGMQACDADGRPQPGRGRTGTA
jgi:two-component system response regulator PilR (NtrC family)